MSFVQTINYGFVVLNYMNYKDTIECVSSLLAIGRDDYCVVVVDNCSQNESIGELQRYFSGNEVVVIISSSKNIGYSGGNNIGIKWLCDRAVNNIIIATNDTVLLSEDILDKFDALNLDDVGIVGPNILSLEGDMQNPALIEPSFLYFANLFFYMPMKFIRNTIYTLFNGIKQRRRSLLYDKKLSMVKVKEEDAISKTVSVYMLHGAFFFITKNFIDKVGQLDENIFMYCEEDLLSWQCEKKGLSRLFMPSISVLHKESKSSELVHKAEKYNFIESNIKKSRKYVNDKIGLFTFIFFLIKLRIAKC